ncbi:MAG: FG-GAP-like repeat-containing protein, partial [Dokdonella sp.]
MRFAVMLTLLTVFATGACAAVAAPTPMSVTELGRLSLGFNPASTGPFAVADFDQDGADDIVLAGNAGQDTLLQVYGRRSGAYVSKQMLVLPGPSGAARVIARAQAGHPHLFAIMRDGKGYEFAGWPLHQLRSFDIGLGVSAAAIGDVNNDGNDELVVSSDWSGGVEVLDLATLAVRWTAPTVRGSDLLLTQLDADPALEIVVAGVPGVILDGATGATDWVYKDGFGDFLAAYHGGSTPQFFGARAWGSMTVFQGQPYSPLWDVSVFNVGAVAAHDLDGDGKDEIIEGDAQWGAVNIYDGNTHTLVLSIPHQSYSSSAVAAVDLDHDGVEEIAYASSEPDFKNAEVFALYDAVDGSTKWRINSGPSAPYAGASVSIGASGALRFLFGAKSPFNSGGAWAQVGGFGGLLLWQSAPDDAVLPVAPVASISLSDSGAGSGFVAAGGGSNGAVIVAIDDATHAMRWQIDGASGDPLENRYVMAMTAVPRPTGEPDTGVACLEQSGSARLFSFGLADGQPQWESVLMSSPCVGVMAGDFGGSRLLVAVLEGALRAYDSTTHLLAWSLPKAIDGATLLNGVSGREFVVFHDSQLTFHDAATRAVLRQFDLGQPIQAVQELDNIHTLVVSAGGRLLLVDGANGQVLTTSDFLGSDLAAGNQLAT